MQKSNFSIVGKCNVGASLSKQMYVTTHAYNAAIYPARAATTMATWDKQIVSKQRNPCCVWAV